MMPNEGWKITIHGGFAWVFEEPGLPTGPATRVTVGPYVKSGGHPEVHPHEMVLQVPKAALISATHASVEVGDSYAFVLRGDVKLNAAASGEISRRIQTVEAPKPKGWDDFYWVYDADRFMDRSGRARTKLTDGWQRRLLARLELRGGRLEVLAPHFAGEYEMVFDTKRVVQPLATHIDYHPVARPERVEFIADGGNIIASPRYAKGGWTHFDIVAACGCKEDPAVREIPGFDVTFDLYGADAKPPRFTPRFTGFKLPNGANAPGADCPPRSYSI
jgi:hypothetical protein